jgi:hypothetical protein
VLTVSACRITCSNCAMGGSSLIAGAHMCLDIPCPLSRVSSRRLSADSSRISASKPAVVPSVSRRSPTACCSRAVAQFGSSDILIHSPDGDESEFKKIGWRTNEWEKQLKPDGWEWASYASPHGVGKVFLVVSGNSPGS